MNDEPRIHFVATQQDGAEDTAAALRGRYGTHSLDEAEVIVALGGDGFMLRTLHRHLPTGLPVYGMKLGDVGFLMNRFREEDLYRRLNEANVVALNPLSMTAHTEGGGQSPVGISAADTLPGFWKMTWMFWMQPVLLHQTVRACGIEDPNESIISLWQRDSGNHHEVRRRYARQLATMLLNVLVALRFIVLLRVPFRVSCPGPLMTPLKLRVQ